MNYLVQGLGLSATVTPALIFLAIAMSGLTRVSDFYDCRRA